MVYPEWINNYIGIPFKPKGRDRRGVDCWGLVVLIYREQYKIHLPSHLEDYNDVDDSTMISGAILRAESSGKWERVQQRARFSDVALLRVHGLPTHIGFMVDSENMLHAWLGANSCIESTRSIHWQNRLLGVFRRAA